MTPLQPPPGEPARHRAKLRLAAEPVPVIATPGQLCEALGIGFSDEQLGAITAPLEPGVIIAGAGSGKTTVMAARVVWLVGSGALRPEQVLGLTFTRKAAAELSARVRAALQRSGAVDTTGVDEAGEQVIMTYDAYAARLLGEHGLRIGVDSGLKMITGATRFRLATRVVRAAAGPFEHLSRILPVTVADRVLRLDAEMRSHLIAAEELDAHAREYRVALGGAPAGRGGKPYAAVLDAADKLQERLELARLVADYQRLKADLGVVEFADQMALAAQLVERAPAVAQAQRETFSVVLLDEYQDTSAAQAKLLQGLFSGPDPATGRGHPVTAVGDPYQAIYGWRGAAASNILGFATDFPRGSGEPAHGFNLRVNRRSGQAILDVANQIATSLTASGGGGHRAGLIAPPEAGQGQVRAATFETWGEELSWIGDEIVAAREHEDVTRFSDIAVLARRNEDLGAMFGELAAREIPAEIVGLGGLLSLPEVADVVATLRLLDDVTANPDLVRLLSGARWRIGPDDLALLGRRARELARTGPEVDVGARLDEQPADPDWRAQLAESLDQAVSRADRSEVICLLDALDDPGNLGYSAAARQRFALLSAELATLRRHTGEPVLDLTRRVVEAMGLGVELVATAEYVKTSRRDQLAAFVDAVAGYVDVDGDGSLTGLLGYLQAEADTGNGLDQAVPSAEDSVKLLTVHRAKGLEWELVFLPALMQGIFPSERVTNNWVTTAEVVPNELRGDAGSIAQLADATRDAMVEFKAELKAEHQLSEDRLAYVAVTRAKRTLVGTGHYWRPAGVEPRTPSRYLQAILDAARPHDRVLREATAPGTGESNPLIVGAAPTDWPAVLDPAALERRRLAAAAVGNARRRFADTGEYEADGSPMPLDEESVVAQWDGELASLLAEARRLRAGVETVALPASLTASQLIQLASDPQAYAAELLRPMPRRPAGAARLGTLFHTWVERFFGQGTLFEVFDPEERLEVAPERRAGEAGSGGTGDEPDAEPHLAALTEAFGAGQFADRTPMALESSFSLLLGESVIRGRIDAVFRDLDPESGFDYQVIDWKTGRGEAVDDLQLAIYRLAWAQRMGVELSRVDACFYFVATDRLVRPRELPGERGLADLLAVARD